MTERRIFYIFVSIIRVPREGIIGKPVRDRRGPAAVTGYETCTGHFSA